MGRAKKDWKPKLDDNVLINKKWLVHKIFNSVGNDVICEIIKMVLNKMRR